MYSFNQLTADPIGGSGITFYQQKFNNDLNMAREKATIWHTSLALEKWLESDQSGYPLLS